MTKYKKVVHIVCLNGNEEMLKILVNYVKK